MKRFLFIFSFVLISAVLTFCLYVSNGFICISIDGGDGKIEILPQKNIEILNPENSQSVIVKMRNVYLYPKKRSIAFKVTGSGNVLMELNKHINDKKESIFNRYNYFKINGRKIADRTELKDTATNKYVYEFSVKNGGTFQASFKNAYAPSLAQTKMLIFIFLSVLFGIVALYLFISKIKITDISYIHEKEKIFMSSFVVFMATFLCFYHQMDFKQDLTGHAIWSLDVLAPNTVINSYPIWHIVCKIIHDLFGFSLTASAALSSAFFNLMTFWATIYLWNKFFPDICKDHGKFLFWILVLCFVGPLYLPEFNINYYVGQGTPNTWHNPTNLAVKPFMMISFTMIMGLLIERKYDIASLVCLSFMIFLSVLTKPSFLQGIVPGLGLFMLISVLFNRDKKLLKEYFYIASSFVPAVAVLVVFAIELAGGNGRGIGLKWAVESHNFTTNVGISFLLSSAFPVTVFLFNWKSMIKDKVYQVAVCFGLAAWLEANLLYFKTNAEFGDFGWSYLLSQYLVWAVSMAWFLRSISGKIEYSGIRKKYDPAIVFFEFILLGLHSFFGILFWMQQSGIFFKKSYFIALSL